MTILAKIILILFGLLLLVGNTVNAKDAGKPRKDLNYPSVYLYVLDALAGVILLLIAFGVF